MKTPSDKLVAKVNGIDHTGFVLKTKNDRDKTDLEKKTSKKFLILVDVLKNRL